MKGFRIYRKPRGADTHKLLTPEALPANTREYADTAIPASARILEYGVTAVLSDGTEIAAPPRSVVYKYVPEVTGLKAKRVVKGQKTFIQYTWDSPAADEKHLVDGYIVGSAKGKRRFSYNASLEPIRTRTYNLPYRVYRDTTFTIGVAVKSTFGSIGEFTKEKIQVRGALWEGPSKPKFREYSSNHIYCTMRWEYPEDDRLAGFRIYTYRSGSGDEPDEPVRVLADVPANARSFRVGPHIPRAAYIYYLRAFDHDGILSAKGFNGLVQVTMNPKQGTLMAGELIKIRSELSDLKATFQEDPMGPDFVDVSWDLGKDDLDLVRYYLVQPEQKDAAVGEMPAKTTDRHIRIPIREDFNGQLKVGVQVEHIQGKLYEPQYVALNIPARQPMPDFFPRKQILLYCGIASGFMFIVLIVGLLRRNKTAAAAA